MSNPELPQKLTITVLPESSGLRLDKFLADQPEIGSRSQAAKLIELAFVTKNQLVLKPSYRLQEGDVLTVLIPKAPPLDLQPLDLPLHIVFEDDDCAVINKPAGLVVHPAAGHAQDTLVNALVGQMASLSSGAAGCYRPGIVHRLDKDTSGLIVVAKNDRAHEALAQQFKNRQVHRVYWALVIGQPKVPQARIESLLARHPRDRKKFASASRGKRAVTHYELLKSTQGLSLLRCRLETGRTHQIRVHLSEQGHPMVGDQLYARRAAVVPSRWRAQVAACLGIGLHACELGFNHPVNGTNLKFSVTWPADWAALIARLEFSDVSKPLP